MLILLPGLLYMLLRKVYSDGFILHDESPYEELDEDEREEFRKASEKAGDFQAHEDAREVMVSYVDLPTVYQHIQILCIPFWPRLLLTTWKLAWGLPDIATTNIIMQTGFRLL